MSLMKYDIEIKSPDGFNVLLIKHLFKRFGWEINLHKIVSPDAAYCFHTHPAKAFRIILKGGYYEQLSTGEMIKWSLGNMGFIYPEFEHRIHALKKGSSYTLWIRGPITAEIKTRGC